MQKLESSQSVQETSEVSILEMIYEREVEKLAERVVSKPQTAVERFAAIKAKVQSRPVVVVIEKPVERVVVIEKPVYREQSKQPKPSPQTRFQCKYPNASVTRRQKAVLRRMGYGWAAINRMNRQTASDEISSKKTRKVCRICGKPIGNCGPGECEKYRA